MSEIVLAIIGGPWIALGIVCILNMAINKLDQL